MQDTNTKKYTSYIQACVHSSAWHQYKEIRRSYTNICLFKCTTPNTKIMHKGHVQTCVHFSAYIHSHVLKWTHAWTTPNMKRPRHSPTRRNLNSNKLHFHTMQAKPMAFTNPNSSNFLLCAIHFLPNAFESHVLVLLVLITQYNLPWRPHQSSKFDVRMWSSRRASKTLLYSQVT